MVVILAAHAVRLAALIALQVTTSKSIRFYCFPASPHRSREERELDAVKMVDKRKHGLKLDLELNN